jgi:uncharacterized protein YprB with RNaseH-like and TPR domain
VAPEVSPWHLVRALPDASRLFTFNGHSFDLPVIRKQLGIDLRARFDSVDLRHVCRRAGWTGGLKAIERRLGVGRRLPDVDGRDAQRLWARFRARGDDEALRLLLLYNREDVLNMVRVRAALRRSGVIR